MAKVSYRIRSKSNSSNILIQFNINRDIRPEVKTGLIIDAQYWNSKIEKITDKNVITKNLKTQLLDLKTHILKEYNLDFEKGIVFNKEWLELKINNFFNRKDETIDLNFLTNYINDFIENRKLNPDFKPTTNQKFKTLLTKIESFEKQNKVKYLLKDFDQKLFNKFRFYLMAEGKLMETTANRTLKNLKTILRDARFNGFEISHQVDGIKTEVKSDVKIYLSFEEIEQIKKTHIIGSNNAIAKDWLIIGCFLGQRVGDLMKMNKSMIYKKINAQGQEFEFIELKQEKTGQNVSIPIHSEVKKILKKYNGEFPPLFSTNASANATLFNRYLKEVAGICEINTIVKGKVFNDELGRNEIVETEKHNLITSHVCRRSFATNFYADKRFPTPLLMAITGHKTERVFLEYIGKTSSDYAMDTAETFAQIENEKQKLA
ncbi:tyrosine-type recombinase/integrase [Faecalibacter rhinopitheci]|uniref:Phage integrase SAM-like domain-containing protein n=1 Tax=Faecalibacter rhinopitheci TaxID=2779678 RepID=A0A8J7FN26_9FLAO|nr:phage integrase SAM-like domain-containing protein [Faecalibacter rhinopitheci]MBF0596910.1 phage integrase SAM-like domain-containing protein [Faecalibacter rhinopitheci]